MQAIVADAVPASAVADLIVERYDYRFTADGLPMIELTVRNPGTAAIQADLTVKVTEAVQSAQNEYRYHDVGEGKSLRGTAIMPGREEQLIVRDAPMLKAGDYDAEIRLEHLKDAKLYHVDFSVSPEAVAGARSVRERNKTDSQVTSADTGWAIGALVAGACLIAVVVAKIRRFARLAMERKQGNNRL